MLHQHFKTPLGGGAIRSYYLARALVAAGHRVVMITTFSEKKYRIENIEGIDVHYLPIPYDNRLQFYSRGWAFVRFVVGSMMVARKFRDFDMCYAISVPLTVGIVAQWIKFRFKLPYIFEVGDLWPDAPIQMGYVRNHIFQRLLYTLEKSIYQKAQSVVALSAPILSFIEGKAPGKKVHLIPNMSDCDFYRPEEKKPSLLSKFGVEGKLVVSYIGALGVANGLDYFMECASTSQMAQLPVHFILCGDGAMRAGLETNIKKLDLHNVSLLEFVNRDGVKEIMNVTDAVFVCYKMVPILETGCPNKFFDGLASGKLIVINFRGWIKEEIEEERCGVFVDPLKPIDFMKKINKFIADKKLLQAYKTASRQLAERKYSRTLLSGEFQRIFS